ncbi:hypothetical protein BB561_003181 [Smittium simulii]|uniref:Repressor of RNA polymerase III transcription MAF1 n=1 Tax=Smittium simulii TaxID=133385 RepID=A0A2T9YMK8_9FUNG|nr:hypothetical protein BB561_003181 [Smittium simulii]
MKFLQIPSIDSLNELLSFKTTSGHYVIGRIEVYSCKVAGNDKKLYKYLQHKYSEDEVEARSISTSLPAQNSSPPLPSAVQIENSTKRTLFYLISTLNASFPDYDFRTLWRELDSVIDLDDCQLFAYTPDPESDPYGDEFPVESQIQSGFNSYASFASIGNEIANPDENLFGYNYFLLALVPNLSFSAAK